jgi:hypothetical protein
MSGEWKAPLTFSEITRAFVCLNRVDLMKDGIESCGHQLMHFFGLVAFDEIRLVPIADEQASQLFFADAREHCWIGNLVTIQMQNRQHRAISSGIEKLV